MKPPLDTGGRVQVEESDVKHVFRSLPRLLRPELALGVGKTKSSQSPLSKVLGFKDRVDP